MVVVDANVLLYAINTASVHHERSRSWLDASLAGGEAVGLAWIALLAFIRIATSPSILVSAMTVDEAAGQVEDLARRAGGRRRRAERATPGRAPRAAA